MNLPRYEAQFEIDYGLTRADFDRLVETAKENAFAGTATEIGEQTARDLDHDEWLDDQSHPLWDVAAAVDENKDLDDEEKDE